MKFLVNIIILGCVAALGWSSYYLFRELTSKVDRKGGEVIGTVVFKKKNASRRYTDSVIWEDIAQESEIYNYDAIRTMDDSSATLTLKDGTKIELDQNTMLVVIMDDKSLNINFDKGGVTAQNTAGGAAVVLNSKDASISLGKGDISVNSDDSGTNIQLNSGSAKVSAGGKELAVASNEIATLKSGVAQKNREVAVPEYPRQNMNIVTFGKMRSVNFSWKNLEGFLGETRVDISKNRGFRPVYRSFTTRRSSYTLDLPPGEYYWRIVRNGVASRLVKFSILKDKKPELFSPYKNQKVVLTEGAGLVTFRWDKSRYAVSYELTAARDSSMKDKVLEISSKINTMSTSQLQPGAYYWSVKSVYPPGMESESTETGPVRFLLDKRDFALLRPVPLDQGPLTTGAAFNLNWKGIDGAGRYTVELASDSEFKKSRVKKSSSNTFSRIEEKLSPGTYYWRVNAVRGKSISEWSETAQIILTEPVKLVTLNPEEGEAIYVDAGDIEFAWKDPNRGGRYLIEISGSKDFREIKDSRLVSSSETRMKIPGSGVFYWRVSLKDAGGRTVTASNISDFVIPQTLEMPVLVSPKDNQKITPGYKKGLRLRWEGIKGVNEYEIEIFQRVFGIDKSVSIYTSKKPFIDLSNEILYKPGRFGWLVRAKKVKGGRVIASRESKKSYFEIEEVDILPAPKIKSPDVLFNSR